MADDTKKAEIAIVSTYDGRGAQQAAADQEKLTIGQQNLAPATAAAAEKMAQFDAALSKETQSLIDATSAKEPFIVSSEKEYVSLQKAHDALLAKIPALQAAGKETKDYEEAVKNLSAALSTDAAISFAEKIEQKASAASKAEAAFSQNISKTMSLSLEADAAQVASSKQAEAAFTQRLGSLLNESVILDEVAVKESAYQKAVAALSETQKGNAASTALSATSLREVLTIIRELEAGRMTRVPGSLSILLQQATDLGPALQAGLIAGSAAAFILLDVVKGIHQEWVKVGEEIEKAGEHAAMPEFISSIEKQREAVAGAAADMQGFADALAAAAEKEATLTSQLQQELGLLQAIERARAALTSAQKELDIAKVQTAENTGQITPERAAEQRAAIEKKYIQQAQDDRERSQNEELNARQVALEAAKNKQAALDKQAADAEAKAGADKAHTDHVAIDPKTVLEEIQKLRAQMDAERQIIAEPQNASELGQRSGLLAGNVLERQQAQMDMLEKQLLQFQGTQTPEYQARVKADADAADKTRQAALDNAKLQGELTKQIADLKAEIEKVRPIEEQTTRTKTATVSEQESGRIAKQFEEDARVINEYDKSKKPSPELVSRAATAILDMQGILKDHTDLLQNIANLGPILQDLKTAIARAKNSADNQF
ncbi:MAG TPA: hypothetical protein VGY56_10745 [Verrucomicrobiae bacterium]|nr:hypothetical protein [Verrucomicrobiae bacterium]